MSTEFIPKVPPIYQTQLAFELDPADTTATIATELLISGVALSGLVCFSVDIGQPNPEYMIGTLSGNTLTITLRNVDPLDPTTSIGAFTSVHRQGAIVKITDFATIQIMRNILSGLQAVQNPLMSTSPAVLSTDIPNYGQLQALSIAGGLPASTSVMGLTRISADPSVVLGNPTITIASPSVITLASHGLTVNDIVKFTTSGTLPTGIVSGTSYYVISTGLTANAFEISATAGGTAINTSGSQSGTHILTKLTPVAVGVNDYRFGPNNFGVSATGTDAYAITLASIPAAYVKGQMYAFQADVANTGAATININGLGAKTIKKNVSTDLATGDILANQIVIVEYDGTNMQMVNNLPSTDIQTFISSGSWSIPTGAKKVVVELWGGGGSGGGADGTTTNNGGGGGGGGYLRGEFLPSQVSSPVTITIPASVAGGIGANNGVAGGNVTFGTYLIAYGGGGGAYVTNNNAAGGGGGGMQAAGATSTTTTGGVGGGPQGGAADAASFFGGGGGASSTAGGASYYGGGGGGRNGAGGSTTYGGGGGGSRAAAAGSSIFGGGGGASVANTNGADGIAPGGGGGGGDRTSGAAKNGGAGAVGQIIVTTFF